jgi:hypothetical protein
LCLSLRGALFLSLGGILVLLTWSCLASLSRRCSAPLSWRRSFPLSRRCDFLFPRKYSGPLSRRYLALSRRRSAWVHVSSSAMQSICLGGLVLLHVDALRLCEVGFLLPLAVVGSIFFRRRLHVPWLDGPLSCCFVQDNFSHIVRRI